MLSSQLNQELIDASNAVEQIQANKNEPEALVDKGSTPELLQLPTVNGHAGYKEDYENGFAAEAFTDVSGNIIIAYEGSDLHLFDGEYANESEIADWNVLLGKTPKALFDDAISFANSIHSEYPTSNLYVTGHSLGGVEAEAAAEKLTFISGGDTFGAPGLPNYYGATTDSLTDFVDSGDPVGNYAADTDIVTLDGDHYGTVVRADKSIVHYADGLFAGLVGLVVNTDEAIGTALYNLATYHPLANYAADLNLPINPPSSGDATGNNVYNEAFLLDPVEVTTPAQTNADPFPFVDNTLESTAQTGSITPISNWFSAKETNSGGIHTIVGYNLFIVSGSGTLVVNGKSYALDNVAENVSPAEFATASFDAGQTPGVNEIAVIAIDDLGNYSVAGDLTVSVVAPSVTPESINPTDSTPPTIVTPSQQALAIAGGNLTFNSKLLDLTDSNTSHYAPSQLTYVITSAPSDGYLLKSGSIVTSFTQQDINNGLIEYQENGTTISTDQFAYYVSDPAGNRTNVATFNIQIQAPPSLTTPILATNAGISVGQDLSSLITEADLNVTDSGVNSWQIIYTLSSDPTDGQILADGSVPVTYFTQQQVDLGLISYKNDGSASGPDNFTFTIADGMGGSVGQTTFDVNVIPKNNLNVTVERPLYTDPEGQFALTTDPNAPYLISTVGDTEFRSYTNTPGWVSLLSSDVLSASDPGVDPSNITYTVVNMPANVSGMLIGQWGTPEQTNYVPFTGLTIAPIDITDNFAHSFTQAQVNADEVFYRQQEGPLSTGQEYYGEQFSMVLSASDNAGNLLGDIIVPIILGGDGLLTEGTFVSKSQIPAPNMTASIGASTTIGPGLLTYISNQFADNQITYSLWYAPEDGSVLLNGTALAPNATFTQLQLDKGLVTYDENGTAAKSDEFGLKVTDPNDPSSQESSFTVSVTLTGTNGGHELTSSTGDEILFPGVGNNYLFGDVSTTVSYANSPNGIVANLATGSVSNGYGGTDTLTDISSIIGSAYSDTFIAGDTDTFAGGGGEDTFEGTATKLSGSTITDLSVGDKIIITDANPSDFTFQQTGTTLSFDPDISVSQTLDTLTLSNDPLGDFVVSTDAVSGVDLTFDNMTCYCAGTRILTDKGEVEVTNLDLGDKVVTTSGEPRPIKWIGHRKVDIARHPRPELARPVRIQAGALGEKMPLRDLLLSPEHALWLENALIPARDLINGATIRQEAWSQVEYFHVELESHDILLAEGVAAESYLDCDNRSGFDNAPDGVVMLHPDWRRQASSRPFASPAQTARLRADFEARAGALGRGQEIEAFQAEQRVRGRVARTNFVRNPRAEGRVCGTLGQGGCAPTHWRLGAPEGIEIEVVGCGDERGLPFVDLRFAGRAEAGGNCCIYPEPSVSARPRQDWTVSCHLKRVRGGFDGVEAVNLYIDEYGTNGDYLIGQDYPQPLPTPDNLALQRLSATRRMSNPEVAATTGYVQIKLAANSLVDITLRVGGTQIEEGPYASDLMLPPRGVHQAATRDGAEKEAILSAGRFLAERGRRRNAAAAI